MKKVLTAIICVFALNSLAQIRSGYYMPDSLIKKRNNALEDPRKVTGTCASPNGGMNSIGAPPGSYAALQAGGYCKPSGTYGSSGTVCWTFTSGQPSVSINSGYSATGCGSISFGPFNLFTCAPACAAMGTGLNYSITPGQCYTFCMGYNGTGGFCTFNDFCPYFFTSNPLPIELSYFAGSNQSDVNVLEWKTQTEKNNNYFSLEISSDALNWEELNRIKAAGNSNHPLTYSYAHKNFQKQINYYRLKQVDYNGTFSYHGIVAINNVMPDKGKITRILNILGQEVEENYEGVKIIYYSDGSVIKKF